MQTETIQISSAEKLFDLSKTASTIEYEGRELSIEWLNEYHSELNLYHSQYLLLDNKILVISSEGIPNPLDIKKAIRHIELLYKKKGIKGVDVIWDVKFNEIPSIRVRKALIHGNKQLSKLLRKRYLVLSRQFNSLAQTFKFIYQGKVKDLYFSGSVDEALKNILFHQHAEHAIPADSASSIPSRKDLLEKSKEELVDIIDKYRKSYETSKNKVVDAIGQISWKGKIKKIGFDAHENESNFELINAFSLLQHDVGEIIKEYKELNQNLELKVAERIVDFIDKESNLRAILDNSDRVIWLMNTRYELIDFNVAFLNEIKKRYKKKPKINQNVLEIMTDEREQLIWMDRFESALKGKPGIYLDQDNYDNLDRVLEIKTFPIREIGKIKGVAVYIEDITELKDSQFRLIEKNRDLEKVNSELDSFVYRVSHDLRAPLTSILGLISLMKIETNHEKISEYIGLQEKSVKKLDMFIKEIINLSRNSRLGITVSNIDFDELLNEIFESQHYTKDAEEIKRICEIEDGLSFFTDRQRLSIILNNLISNSLKYMDPQEKDPFVKVQVAMEKEECIIRVSDNGIGISEVYLPKIFEMFFRATKDFSGSGLGLYIVKETVEKLKGRISVKSKTREGSTFQVRLPNLKDRYDAAPKLED